MTIPRHKRPNKEKKHKDFRASSSYPVTWLVYAVVSLFRSCSRSLWNSEKRIRHISLFNQSSGWHSISLRWLWLVQQSKLEWVNNAFLVTIHHQREGERIRQIHYRRVIGCRTATSLKVMYSRGGILYCYSPSRLRRWCSHRPVRLLNWAEWWWLEITMVFHFISQALNLRPQSDANIL